MVFLSRCREEQEIEKCGKKVKEKVPVDRYDILLVSPNDFHTFLKKWVAFLQSLDLVTTVTQHSILELSNDDNGDRQ